MGWKNWPYWLKGGILGSILSLIILVIIFSLMSTCYDNCPSFLTWIGIFGFPFKILLEINIRYYASIEEFIFMTVIYLLTYFIIGAIIGFIYGKIKSRKK